MAAQHGAAYAEAALIGGVCQNNAAFWRVCGIVTADDFRTAEHQQFWRAIQAAAETGDQFDAVSLSENAGLDLVKLATLVNETPGAANVMVYARIVAEASMMRQASTIVEQRREAIAAGDADALTELQSALERLHASRANSKPSFDFQTALAAGLDDIELAQQRAKAGGGLVGVPTGVEIIDRRTGGLSGGKLIILAARPSLGKTALAMQAAQAAAEAGHAVGVCSLEMGAAEIAIRGFAYQFDVNNTALAAGVPGVVAQLTNKIAANPDKLARVKQLQIHIDEDSFTIGGIVSRITEWHRRHNIKLAIVDHLQLVEVGRAVNRNDAMGEITRQLKILAKRLGIPVLLLCQLNRQVEREARKPKLADLRDSGNIEQDADIVLSLHGDLEPNAHGCRDVEIGFLKFRGGLVGWAGTVLFDGPTQKFKTRTFNSEEF